MHHWPQARNILAECGPYQLQAVLRTRGIHVPVEELYLLPSFRTRDWSLPWFMPAILRRYGIASRWRYWRLRSFKQSLINALSRGTPVLIVINSIQGTGCLHWISAWGYDEAAEEFLCYDSQAVSVTSPHGNIRYSPLQLLKSLPYRGSFVVELL